MSQVLIRNVDSAIIDRLKARARENDRSLQAELRIILAQAAQTRRTDFWEAARRVRERIDAHQTDSTELVREDRER